jgi:hypothetical protein
LSNGDLASSSSGGSLAIWDVCGKLKLKLKYEHADFYFEFCRLTEIDPETLAVSNMVEHEINFWSLSTGSLVRSISNPDFEFLQLALLRDDEHLAAVMGDDKIGVVNYKSGELVRMFTVNTEDIIWSLLTLPDGNLAVCATDPCVEIWNPNTGRLVKTLVPEGHAGSMTMASANTLAVADLRDVNIFNLDGELLKRVHSYAGSIISMALLENGRLAVLGRLTDLLGQTYSMLEVLDIGDEAERLDVKRLLKLIPDRNEISLVHSKKSNGGGGVLVICPLFHQTTET